MSETSGKARRNPPKAAGRDQDSSSPPVTSKRVRRRKQLLDAVAEHILEHGVVDFSLRRAAATAGTTHRILLYHFGSAPELIQEALAVIRAQRVETARASGTKRGGPMLEAWNALMADQVRARVLLEGIGLALAKPESYGKIGIDSIEQYLPPIETMLPTTWPPARRAEVATLILAVIRGLMLDAFATGDSIRVESAMALFERLVIDEGWLEQASVSRLVDGDL